MTDLHKRIADLSPERRAKFEEQLSRRRVVQREQIQPLAKPLIRVSRDEELQLSFAQERLWFLDRLYPGDNSYNVPAAFQLTGLLDVHALEQSFTELVRRHESLRTTFASSNGYAYQQVDLARPIPLPLIDLRGLPEPQRDAEARRQASAEARHPFDLVRGPLFRATLLQLDGHVHILLMTMHHIVTDGWSMGVLFRELSTVYAALAGGKPSPLVKLPLQYADYAAWQRRWLEGEVLEKQLAYWKQQLAGAPAVLELPTDRPRPRIQSFRGARQSFALSPALTQGLRELSQRERVTLFMTLLAAFEILLCRYTGKDDICVGTPIANRTRQETEGLIGFFVNTLVMRGDLSGDPSFRELLQRVRRCALDAYDHQDLPFEKLVEELQPERSMSHSPLFQAMFATQQTPGADFQLAGVRVDRYSIGQQTAKFDLDLSLSDTPQGLQGSLSYNTDLFNAPTVERMVNNFQLLLKGIVADPDEKIGELPLVTETEKQQLLVEWNDTAVDHPRDACIHELFEAQVQRTPSSVAVESDGTSLTYRQLDERANRLAAHLVSLGVAADTLVGLYVDRSADMLVGMLGILKAGGAYVPLSPGTPTDRLLYILEETGAPIVLTEGNLAGNLPHLNAAVVRLDGDWDTIANSHAAYIGCRNEPARLAYVMFTSGSTGKPKGVQIEHHTVVNFLESMARKPGIACDDVLLAVTTMTFDISVLELFLPLSVGAKVVIVNRDVPADAVRLTEALSTSGATIMQATPATWRMLVESGWVGDKNLKILCGGEALPLDLANELVPRCGSLWNMYGPTETTIWSVVEPFAAGDSPISIGRPIANTQIYVLDQRMQPVPIRVTGDLYIGGHGLARGYLNRPELTAEKFINDPIRLESGARMYKTGDLARFRPDGKLDFLGRSDFQVKVRGYRIELGEIEAVLHEHPAIRQAVVMARQMGPHEDDKQLIGYVISDAEDKPNVTELREFLRVSLPDYMLPASFVWMNEFPLNPAGKVDRKALPSPDTSRPELRRKYTAPRNATEEILAEIWQDILGVKRVGIHDNFFELGGHSLLATRVVSQLRGNFQTELPLRDLFEYPAVASLAQRIEHLREPGEGQSLAQPLMRVSRDEELPLSFSQERQWFLVQLEPGTSAYNIPVTLRLTGRLDVTALERSFREVQSRHENLRTSFPAVDGQPVQCIAEMPSVKVPVADLRDLPDPLRDAEVQRLAIEAAGRSFDLARGPLWQVTLLRLSEDEHILLLTIHHIVTDGWSNSVLLRELSALYEAFSTGKSSPLPELPIQYADYAAWQRKRLQGETLEKLLSYWKRQLDGAAATLELPTDHRRPAIQTYRGAKHTLVLSSSLTETLKTFSRDEGATLFMTLLSAFKLLLYRYTAQDDISVGTFLASRNRMETEGLIGFFINNLVLRTDLSGNPSFRKLLARVREMTLGAYMHQDLPFETLLDELRPERDPSRTPLFQVMFVLQNTPKSDLTLPGVTVSNVGVKRRRTNFDLTLWMTETSDGLTGTLDYNRDLFEPTTIAAIAERYEFLLHQIVSHPEQQLLNIPLQESEGYEQNTRMASTLPNTAAFQFRE